MAETVGQHSVAAFTSPVNGTSPIDANTVKGNDNTIRSAYVDHDADPGIHVQSSTLASRPVANSAGRKWMTQDSGVIRLFYDDGTSWYEVDYLRTTGGTISGNLSITGTLAVTGVATFTAQPILSSLTASRAVFTDGSKGLVSNAITGTGDVVMSASPTLTGTITAASATLSGTLGVSGLLTFASLKGTGATTVTNILDEDNMASDSATALATQQSIKAYVDAQVGASDALSEVLAIGNTTGANDIIVSAGQKIRTPAVAAQDGSSAITIANTTGALTLATALADSNLATISTAGKVSNSATTATSANTASAIVARDASGNFTAGTITAALSGNASTATTLQTARNINGVSFNGSADITVTAAAGTLTGTTLASNVTASSLTSVGTLANLTVTNPITGSVTGSSGSTTGNAATATALQTARNINGVSFNGTADITVTAAAGTLTGTTLASGVTASSLTSVGTLTSLTVSGNTTLNSTSGNTLIGTTTVAYSGTKLNIGTTSDAQNGVQIQTSTTGVGYLLFGDGAGANAYRGEISYAHTTDSLAFRTASSEKMRLDASGRLGIGTTGPGYPLDVVGFGRFSSGVIGSAGLTMYGDASSASGMFLSTSGNLGIGVTPSAWGTSEAMQFANGFSYGKRGHGVNGYYDGTWKYIDTGYASLYQQGGGTHAFYTAGVGSANAAITFTQAMTLDASGNLGIGVTSPAGRLDVSGTGVISRFLSTNNDYVMLLRGNNATDGAYLGTSSGGDLRIATGASVTERARITSGGYFKASNTGVYLTTGNVHELRSNASDGNVIEVTNSSASPYGIALNFISASPDNNTNAFLSCGDSTTSRCYIYSDGDLANHDGVYGTISDERLKQDIVDAGSQWDDLKAVRFRKYRMKTDVEANPDAPFMLGVVAQELEQTSPGLVDEHPDFEEQEVTDEDGNVTTEKVQVGTTKTVKSSILLMKAAVALQEAMARIESLEARLAALESK